MPLSITKPNGAVIFVPMQFEGQSIRVGVGADFLDGSLGVGPVAPPDPYAVNGFSPSYVAAFVDSFYRVSGATSTFAGAFNFTRTGTATYVDNTGTLQTAATGVARLNHHVWNGSSFVNEGLLFESEEAISRLSYSEEFDNSAWNKVRLSITADAATAPDGTTTADKFIPNTDSATHAITRAHTVTSGRTYTHSLFVKEAENSRIELGVLSAQGGGAVKFDVSAGTATLDVLGSVVGFGIIKMGNGWYRIFLTYTATVTGTGDFQIFANSNSGDKSFVGDGTSGIFIWGAQLEEQPTPTSYVKTGTTGGVTRNAETLTASAANLPYNTTAVSFQMEGMINYLDNNSTTEAFFLGWASSPTDFGANRLQLRLDTDVGTGTFLAHQTDADNVSEQSRFGSFTPGVNVPFNIASRHGAAFVNAAVNGTAGTANTEPTAMPNLTDIDLGIAPKFNGTIKRLRIWGNDIGDTGIAEASA